LRIQRQKLAASCAGLHIANLITSSPNTDIVFHPAAVFSVH
jgi:hypothetical protein